MWLTVLFPSAGLLLRPRPSLPLFAGRNHVTRRPALQEAAGGRRGVLGLLAPTSLAHHHGLTH